MIDHEVGTHEEWATARAKLLEREKELTRMSDELARQRRELPWVPLDKEYTLQTADGPRTLAELFEDRQQLMVYHFMFGPNYEAGCTSCSSVADSVNGVVPHLAARDVTVLFVSRAPLDKILAYNQRMGWSLNWASSYESDFNFDLGFSSREEETRAWVEPIIDELPPIAGQNAGASGIDLVGYLSETQGFSSFARDGDTVYLSYSSAARGMEFLMNFYAILDRMPKGRDEGDAFQTWIRRHDEYAS